MPPKRANKLSATYALYNRRDKLSSHKVLPLLQKHPDHTIKNKFITYSPIGSPKKNTPKSQSINIKT